MAATIKRGSTGADVRRLQQKLKDEGLLDGVDGVFGPNTQAALEKYQENNGLAVDGIAGPEVWSHIDGDATTGATHVAEDRPYTPDTVAAQLEGRHGTVGVEKSAGLVAMGKQEGGTDVTLPGNAGLWFNTTTKQWYVVWEVPPVEGQEEPLYVSWLVPDDADLEAIVGPDVKAKPHWAGSTAAMTNIGVINLGTVAELNLDDVEDAPFDTWVQEYATEAAQRPWILDADWIALSVQAMMERDDAALSVAEMQSTEWWRTHTLGQRTWMEIAEGDPAEAARMLRENRESMRTQLQAAGVTNFTEELVNFMADKTTMRDWSGEHLLAQVAALSDPWSVDVIDDDLAQFLAQTGFDPMQTRKDEDKVRFLLSRWLGPVVGDWSDADVAEAAGIMRNNPESGEGDLVEQLKDQRMAAYSNYSDRNLSYETISKSWQSMAEGIWGVPQIDHTDPLFQQVVRENDPDAAQRQLRQAGFNRGYDRVVNDATTGVNEAFSRNVRGAV